MLSFSFGSGATVRLGRSNSATRVPEPTCTNGGFRMDRRALRTAKIGRKEKADFGRESESGDIPPQKFVSVLLHCGVALELSCVGSPAGAGVAWVGWPVGD
jgi:hypothetical protein